MQRAEQVGAVVERDLRPPLDQRAHVGGVGVGVLAAAAADLDVAAERRGHVVLRRQRVGGAQSATVRAAGGQRPTRLAVSAVTCRQAATRSRERPLGGEPLADRAQDRHLRVRPLDTGETSARCHWLAPAGIRPQV